MHNDGANDFSYWREFDRNEVTHSAAHYLMAIAGLRDEFGYARVTDVAARLNVSRGAVSIAVAQLKKRRLVEEDPHRFLLLTGAGKRVVRVVRRNFRVLSRFFEEGLGVSKDVAQGDACKMEHLMSLETGRRMLRLMQAVLNDRECAAVFRRAIAPGRRYEGRRASPRGAGGA